MSDPKIPVDGEAPRHQALVAVEEQSLHSDIYDRLVRGPDDIPGLVAYGIYQIRKREWIQEHKKRFSCVPTLDEVRKYSFSQRNSTLDSLRHEAEASMYRFAEVFMRDRIDEMEHEAFNERAITEFGELQTLIKRRSGYRHHIVGHVVGFGVLVAIAAVVLWALGHEPTIGAVLDWFRSL